MAPKNLLPTMDALCDALQAVKPSKKITFLVGSPLSMHEDPSAPQVPGVTAMLEIIRSRISTAAIPFFDEAIRDAKDQGGNPYQVAMKFLQVRGAQEAANEVIREAVLKARKHPPTQVEVSTDQLKHLDDDHAGWALPPASRDLGSLVVSHPNRFGPILTTNFDPLLSAAIKQAGGEFSRTVIDGDMPFSQTRSSIKDAAQIIHLHGYWVGTETLHTPEQITRVRPHVREDIRNILETQTVVVVGYGGWDDTFMQTLASLNIGSKNNLDVIWAFFETYEEGVRTKYSRLFDCIESRIAKNQFRPYGGINCHTLFAALRERLDAPGNPPLNLRQSASVAQSPDVPTAPSTSAPVSPQQAPRPRPTPPAPRTEPTTAPAAAAAPGPVITVSPVVTVSPVINQTSSPPPKGRPTSNWLVPVLAVPLFVGGFALVTQSTEHRGVGTEMPPPRNAIPITQRPVFTPFPAPVESISILRQQHQVSIVSTAERASHVDQLPPGRYAFLHMESIPTYNAKTPLFGSLRDGIELHRTPNDELFFVGYVDPQSRSILISRQPTSIALAPIPNDKRSQPVSIPVARLTTAEVRQDNGTRVILLHLNSSR